MTLDLATTVVGVLALLSISVLVGTAAEAAPRRGASTARERRRLSDERQELARAQQRLAVERAILAAAEQRTRERTRHGCPQCGCPISPPPWQRRQA
jgi:hypothetical protein